MLERTAATESLITALTRATRAVTTRIARTLETEDLTLDQWLVVDALSRQRGLAMTDLAERTMATGPTLTRVVDKLVSTAAVYREVDPADRRRVRVYLSPRGRALHKRIAVKVRDAERELLERTGNPEAALTVLDELAGR
ncbi:MarR family transcriptional regulator [Amycolatopsis minnesotensis]|uniref:HTH marR-type domain-containing protein n=1 Tax=Amycolatopsis minnesotensis TaxID=337894 RepID=A0ABN2RQV3_9PSEU